MQADHDRPRRTSELLRAFAEARSEGRISVRELVDALGERSFGLLLLVLALAAWIPVLPPGVPTVFGLAIAAVAGQIVAGRPAPWLPDFAARLSLPAGRLGRLVGRATPWLARAETFARPRFERVMDGVGGRLVALWTVILALVICVPIPMTNSGPALSIAVLSVGLIERDGVIVGIGAALGVVSVLVSVAFWIGAFLGARWLLGG